MDAIEFDSRNLSMIVDNTKSALLNELHSKKGDTRRSTPMKLRERDSRHLL